jgi:hypothetical protein
MYVKEAHCRRRFLIFVAPLTLDILGRRRTSVHIVQTPLDGVHDRAENMLTPQLIRQATLEHPIRHFDTRVANAQLRL